MLRPRLLCPRRRRNGEVLRIWSRVRRRERRGKVEAAAAGAHLAGRDAQQREACPQTPAEWPEELASRVLECGRDAVNCVRQGFRKNQRADKTYRGVLPESTIPCAPQPATNGCGVPIAMLRSQPSNAVSARSHCMRWRSFLSRTRRLVSSSIAGSRSKVMFAG
jgi:hypothetical protein